MRLALYVTMLTVVAITLTARATSDCSVTTFCSDDTSCIPVPTSLPPIGSALDPHGFRQSGGNCGAKRIAGVFPYKACGNPLASEACI